MNKHWRRLWLSVKGKWRPDPVDHWNRKQPGRQSDYKGYLGELGHSAKNVLVEALRKYKIWDRKSKPDGK